MPMLEPSSRTMYTQGGLPTSEVSPSSGAAPASNMPSVDVASSSGVARSPGDFSGASGLESPSVSSTSGGSGGGGQSASGGGQSGSGSQGSSENADAGILVTQSSTSHALDVIRKRRELATEHCADGFLRVKGDDGRYYCDEERPAARSAETSPVKKKRRKVQPAPVEARRAPPRPIEPPLRFGAWAEVHGDFERHSNIFPGENITRNTTSFDAIAGADVTWRGLASASDGAVVGMLAGYEWSRASFSSGAPSIGVQGPAVGPYFSYFSRGLSVDLALKADFLELNQDFGGLAGNFATNMNNYTVAANLNYRFFLPHFWIEPTIGARYTDTVYSNSAAQLSLANGDIWRVQGGARIGADLPYDGAVVTPSLTGLLYDDVSIRGLTLSDDAATITAVREDQGKLRAQGILNVNVAWADGFSVYGQAEVRGGEDVVGIGGKLGIRDSW
jgi:hypothetical protein